ncbi:MAG TPA: DUF4837 family protein [Prolixibacteraceae bacterium]|nr:DUF4837 family protein [Prolixibacteraceae bacterium]
MKQVSYKSLLLVLISLALVSCKFKEGARMETITGKSNEVVVVIGKEIWKGEVGSLIREILAQPQTSLPQEEPIFSLIDVPPEAFINLFKSSRNIVTVKISPTYTEPKVEFARNTWAYPQVVVNIQASSAENFKELFIANGDKIIGYFLKAEKDRLKKTYKDSHEKAIYNALLEEFNLQLYIPHGFKMVKKDSSFAWVRYDTPLITQNLFVYTYPYESDSTFTQKYLIGKRNLVLKNNVPGPMPGSYMTTAMDLPRDINYVTYGGNYACEVRGLWRVENDFMGGPFVSLSVLDPDKKRVITVEGNVYAPKNDKRNYVRQMEAMIYSLEFPGQHQKADDSVKAQANSEK